VTAIGKISTSPGTSISFKVPPPTATDGVDSNKRHRAFIDEGGLVNKLYRHCLEKISENANIAWNMHKSTDDMSTVKSNVDKFYDLIYEICTESKNKSLKTVNDCWESSVNESKENGDEHN
jgi:hypothetical protein